MVGAAISLAGSGYITNGSATDSAAYIAGAEDGIVIGTSGSVENSGTIKGGTQYGIVIDGISHVITNIPTLYTTL